jgi:hypothetical protein
MDTRFVDLLPIARWSVRASSMSSGLKALEPFYRPEAREGIADAASSLVDYEAWLRDRDPARLASIERYNRADCESLAGLRDWLLQLAADVRDAWAGQSDDGTELRGRLVALDHDGRLDAGQVARQLGCAPSDVLDMLARGKEELGVPISAPDTRSAFERARRPA